MSARIVTIDLDSRSYDIYIGSGLLYRLTDFIPDDIEGRSLYIVTDKNVTAYANKVQELLKAEGAGSVDIYTLNPGEGSKSLHTIEKITSWILEKGASRDSMVFAVGGGVVGDIAGFCASITLRGLPYIQIPTTLLSQVDSSVGGKTGVNTSHGKNLLGTFYQPAAVIVDTDTLKTLPKRELLAGYAEVVKYGLIRDSGFFNWLDGHGASVCALEQDDLIKAVTESVKAKAAIVEADEHETGRRALLNLGHTFGHALETAAMYDGRLLHGEGVAIGMIMAFELSVRLGHCPRSDLERVEAHFEAIGLPVRASAISPSLKISVDNLYDIMRKDKKARKGTIRFILTSGIGEAFVSEEADEKVVKDILRESLGDAAQTTKQGIWTRVFSSHS